jgi:hypothetical protein
MTTQTLLNTLSPPTPQEFNETLRQVHAKIEILWRKLDKQEQELEETIRNYSRKDSEWDEATKALKDQFKR